MPIRYSGAPYHYTQIDMSSRSPALVGLRDAFVNSGWSDVTPTQNTAGSRLVLTFTGQPAAAQTVTLDGQVYTARAARSVAGEFTIGTDAAATAVNLAAEINTVQGATLCAAVAGGVVTVYDRRLYPHTFTAAETLNNATLDRTTSTLTAASLFVRSGKTSAGLQCMIRLYDNGYSIECIMSDVDGSAISDGVGTVKNWTITSRVIEFFGCKYQFMTSLMWAGESAGSTFQGGVPYIRDLHVAPVVSAVSNNAGKYQITTATPHGRISGDHVTIAGAEGNTAINGWWPITVIDANNYTLDGSAYAAGYTPNSARAAGPFQIARCFWLVGDQQSRPTFRSALGVTGNSVSSLVCLNQYYYNVNGNPISLVIPVAANGGAQTYNFGGFSDIVETRLAVRPVSNSSPLVIVGEFWNAFLACAQMDRDTMKDNFDGFNWICYGSNTGGYSLWIVRGVAS